MKSMSSKVSKISKKTLTKIKKSKKSRSKTKRNKKHMTHTLSTTPQTYYYTHSSSYSKKTQNGKSEEHGLEVIDTSNAKNLLVRKLNNGKLIETHIPK